MIFLPIVDRELRLASRRGTTYWTRSLLALAASAIGLWFFIVTTEVPSATLAQYSFIGLSSLSLGYCLISGRRFTADCLSGEKRDGTLGLLFLTDLKGYDVVLGKLAATSLRGFYGLLSVVPVLAIPMLMGGVTRGEFWRVVLVLISTFWLSLSVGIFASAISRDAPKAFGMNFSLLLIFIAAPAACAGLAMFYGPQRFIPELMYSCPVYMFYAGFDKFYAGSEIAHFWGAAVVINLLSIALVMVTSRLLPFWWQDTPSGTIWERWRVRLYRWRYGAGTVRKAFRKRLLDVNAFYWLASRVRLKPVLVWAFLVFMFGWWIYVSVKSGSFMMNESLIATVLILNCTLKLWVAVETGQRLAEDQMMGALELLLSTRLTVGDILRGQLLALRRQFFWPLLSVIVIELGLAWMVAAKERIGDWQIALGLRVGTVMLVLDIAALIWVAMAAALSTGNPNQAIIKTIVRVLLLPWILFAVGAAVAAILGSIDRSLTIGWHFYLGMWFWLGFVVDVGLGLAAALTLRKRFREMAIQTLKPVKS